MRAINRVTYLTLALVGLTSLGHLRQVQAVSRRQTERWPPIMQILVITLTILNFMGGGVGP